MVRYMVQHGDTLGTIAVKYRTSVTAIARANGIRDINYIQVGQIIKIPTDMYDNNNNNNNYHDNNDGHKKYYYHHKHHKYYHDNNKYDD